MFIVGLYLSPKVIKNVTKIDFLKVSDLEIDQPLLQRLLGYGTVNVRVFSKYPPVKNINKPQKFLEELQKLVRKRVEVKGPKYIS